MRVCSRAEARDSGAGPDLLSHQADLFSSGDSLLSRFFTFSQAGSQWEIFMLFSF